MLLLTLDTSTRQSSIALCTENELFGEYLWNAGTNHSVELLDHVKRMMAECRLSMQHLDGVAVAIGPGSFNGVRVALATAKALTFALKKPLLGVGTLDIIAAQQQLWPAPVCSVLEAGRGELYAACYLFDELAGAAGELTYRKHQLSEYLLLTPQHLATYLLDQANEWVGVPGERQIPPFLLCGEMSDLSRRALHAQMRERALFADANSSARRGSVLAALALQRLQNGEEDDPLLLEPLYLRRPSITTSTRKRALLGGTT
ncbi:MAG: tRNA (adenosine(37)-N6)-threonylcarbamoyltransferase complex dimerization subunit type 1 TsaB [Chloroflexota bacterium]|nr:tRNA (adenosine(37)-N6)-threonylcarbamoyltransferase complex dimerization subunit type 1 TsaB [Chloroflexota bacterium]